MCYTENMNTSKLIENISISQEYMFFNKFVANFDLQ